MASRLLARLRRLEQIYDLTSEEVKLLLKFPPDMRSIVRDISPDELMELADRLRQTIPAPKKNRKKGK